VLAFYPRSYSGSQCAHHLDHPVRGRRLVGCGVRLYRTRIGFRVGRIVLADLARVLTIGPVHLEDLYAPFSQAAAELAWINAVFLAPLRVSTRIAMVNPGVRGVYAWASTGGWSIIFGQNGGW
jgi:hypothetical protein